jgi:circadian clock protein KaiB
MSRHAQFKFRLYVAGEAQNSHLAVANLKAFCHVHLQDRHEFEIVDVLRHPKRALAEGIFMTPTLVKFAPAPGCRIVGTLSQPQVLLQALGLEALSV